jgi:hypothetical protein
MKSSPAIPIYSFDDGCGTECKEEEEEETFYKVSNIWLP